MWLTAHDLRTAAQAYANSDLSAAERLWTAGRAWSKPHGYREQDLVRCDTFSTGAEVTLAPPPFNSRVGEVKDSVYQLVGTINDWVARLTGYDLLAKLLPLTLGDSGAVRRIGAAWSEMEPAFRAVAADLGHGMDVLSTHWNSDSGATGGASSAFDYHIRQRWIPAFEALAQVCDSGQQICEAMATEYEYVVESLLFALNFYSKRIKKALKTVMTAEKWSTFLWNLWQLVSTMWQMIEDAYHLMVKQLTVFKEAIEMMVANLIGMRNLMRGDFDALKTL
ncbi:hypothetical protein [Micromonospora zhanjiangensis]